MATPLVTTAVREGVATLTLTNPPLNFVTLTLTRELHAALGELAANPEVRVLVVTGDGPRAFCAGSDISEFPRLVEERAVISGKLAFENATYSALAHFPKPTIAAVNGIAYGGGLELAVCCDIVVAGADARLALPEIKLGVFPGSGGTVRVTRRIGAARAKQLMFTGEPIDTQTALGWGLVDHVAPAGQALAMSAELAQGLARGPSRVLQLCKQAVQLALETDEDAAIRQTLPLSDAAFQTEDCREGVRAFFAKRAPVFRHR